MAEQFGRTQNLSFYDQVLLQADKKAEGLVMSLTGGRPNPALQNKITLGLLAEMRTPVIEDALRKGRGERAAMGDVSLAGMRTEGMVQRETMKRAMDEKVREQVLADAKRLGMLKVGEILISESPKIYAGWKKQQEEKALDEDEAYYKSEAYAEDRAAGDRLDTIDDFVKTDFPPERGGDIWGEPNWGQELPLKPSEGRGASPGPEVSLIDLSGSPYEREADYFTNEILRRTPPPASQTRLT